MVTRNTSFERSSVWLVAGAIATVGCGSASSNDGPSDPGPDAAQMAEGGVAHVEDGGAIVESEETGPRACHPADISGFQPPPYLGPSDRSLACADFQNAGGLLESYADACLNFPATYSSCLAFAAGVPDGGSADACYRCLFTSEDRTADAGRSYGVVFGATIPILNYSGCILAVDPSDEGVSCAHMLNLAAACADYACRRVCPVVDDPSFSNFSHCFEEALIGPCVEYSLPARLCSTALSGDGGTPVGSICFAGSTTKDHYLAMARYFCTGG